MPPAEDSIPSEAADEWLAEAIRTLRNGSAPLTPEAHAVLDRIETEIAHRQRQRRDQ